MSNWDHAETIATIWNEPCSTRDRVRRARQAQAAWRDVPLAMRLGWVRRLRHLLGRQGEDLARTVTHEARQGIAETLAAEIIPLADACRFLELEAPRVLASRRQGRRGRPAWLSGVHVRLAHEPWGLVLVVGAANYPLFLAGVQCLQALVAGNAVLVKPGREGSASAQALRALALEAGLPEDLWQVLSESPCDVDGALEAGVDKVVLTGSANAGRAVLSKLASRVIPATMELSGCDAFWLLPDGSPQRAARALAFGLDFNQSQTCLAPRRVFVPESLHAALISELKIALTQRDLARTSLDEHAERWVREALSLGAQRVIVEDSKAMESQSVPLRSPVILDRVPTQATLLQSDCFAPILSLLPYADLDQALAINAACPYALGAAVFGSSHAARALASRLDVGCVVINDVIAPTADPRVPFGGRHQSGFGVTRGAEGLREMVQIKAVVEQRSRWLPHWQPRAEADQDILAGYLGWSHGESGAVRWSGLRRLLRGVWASRRGGVPTTQAQAPRQTDSPSSWRRSA